MARFYAGASLILKVSSGNLFANCGSAVWALSFQGCGVRVQSSFFSWKYGVKRNLSARLLPVARRAGGPPFSVFPAFPDQPSARVPGSLCRPKMLPVLQGACWRHKGPDATICASLFPALYLPGCGSRGRCLGFGVGILQDAEGQVVSDHDGPFLAICVEAIAGKGNWGPPDPCGLLEAVQSAV